MNIIIANKTDKEQWDQYVLNHPKGIAYQVFAWKDAVEKAYGFKSCYLIAKDKNQVRGILPLIHHKIPCISNSFVSLPYCDAGGPLADTPDIEKELIIEALKLSNQLSAKNVVIRSAKAMAGIESEITVNKKKVRVILSLPSNSYELLSSLKAKVRSQVKKPMKDGLTCCSGGTELLENFYRIFSENMRDLGSPPHSKKWFNKILEAYKKKVVCLL